MLMNNMNNLNMIPMFNPMPMYMDPYHLFLNNTIQSLKERIRRLEEIIKQKDCEIMQLMQLMQLMQKDNNVSFQNINTKSDELQSYDRNDIINVTIQCSLRRLSCFKNQKAEILANQINLKNMQLSANYKPISFDKTIEENGIYDGSIINLTANIYNLQFIMSGERITISLDGDCPLRQAIIYYCEKTNKPYLYPMALENRIIFKYQGQRELNISEETDIKQIFKGNFNPLVDVIVR